ncbi:MAG TPA: LD-carboxypeptidase [Myxococcota bacterium]|nr:LD-carboxypeptidase [Myxococcota bacterium]
MIGLAALSSPFEPEVLAPGVAWMRASGYEVVEPAGLGARAGYLAGDDAHRLAILEALDRDPRIDAVWCVRGGYGLHRLLPEIAARGLLGASDKLLVGFSDVAALAMHLLGCGVRSAHAPLANTVARVAGAEAAHLRRVLAGDAAGARVVARGPVVRGGRAEGFLAGGCVSILQPLVGTPYLPSLRGAILVIEEIDERPYRVDRMLTQLLLAGILQSAAAIAVGDFVKCEPATPGGPTALEVVAERTRDLGIPVLAGFPIGHGPENWAFPVGGRARLDADAGELVFLDG